MIPLHQISLSRKFRNGIVDRDNTTSSLLQEIVHDVLMNLDLKDLEKMRFICRFVCALVPTLSSASKLLWEQRNS